MTRPGSRVGPNVSDLPAFWNAIRTAFRRSAHVSRSAGRSLSNRIAACGRTTGNLDEVPSDDFGADPLPRAQTVAAFDGTHSLRLAATLGPAQSISARDDRVRRRSGLLALLLTWRLHPMQFATLLPCTPQLPGFFISRQSALEGCTATYNSIYPGRKSRSTL